MRRRSSFGAAAFNLANCHPGKHSAGSSRWEILSTIIFFIIVHLKRTCVCGWDCEKNDSTAERGPGIRLPQCKWCVYAAFLRGKKSFAVRASGRHNRQAARTGSLTAGSSFWCLCALLWGVIWTLDQSIMQRIIQSLCVFRSSVRLLRRRFDRKAVCILKR